MNERIDIDWDHALAAVKLNGQWRFFVDNETMFILDYSAYDAGYQPTVGQYRYGIMIVNENSLEAWFNALDREVPQNQLMNVFWEGTNDFVQLTFNINFDDKRWVGSGWKRDQSALQSYQPPEWVALEDDPMKYLPNELKAYFISR